MEKCYEYNRDVCYLLTSDKLWTAQIEIKYLQVTVFWHTTKNNAANTVDINDNTF